MGKRESKLKLILLLCYRTLVFYDVLSNRNLIYSYTFTLVQTEDSSCRKQVKEALQTRRDDNSNACFPIYSYDLHKKNVQYDYGAGGNSAGWDIVLQAARSRVRLPMASLEIFIPSDRTMDLASTQSLTEISTRCKMWFLSLTLSGSSSSYCNRHCSNHHHHHHRRRRGQCRHDRHRFSCDSSALLLCVRTAKPRTRNSKN